jgi:cell fate regulator YaaT (PSP1 superfamily)
MEDTSTTKPKPPRTRRFMLVRYGRMRTLGLFEHNEATIPPTQSRVVIKTEKGMELGTIVGGASAYRAGQLKLSDEQLKKYFDDSEVPFTLESAGRFMRYATPEDINEEKHFQKIATEEAKFCKRLVREMNLPMKIVDAEHILGGERILFYFMSEGRVDFRDLVRKLAQEYQTRIEMRQIGARDEAKLLGDVESCGQRCCCIRYLKSLKPVNMRMAKLQKATLDPSKISGFCGRLKCCLRYEDDIYTELKKRLPPRNTLVNTKEGRGRIIDYQVLAQLVMVELETGKRTAIPRDEIEILSPNQMNNKDLKPLQDKTPERSVPEEAIPEDFIPEETAPEENNTPEDINTEDNTTDEKPTD